jgi:IclR family acetate operon transcriptional repressor
MKDKISSSSAVEKAISVLEAITRDLRPLGVVDIAAELGLPRQTVHRIIRQLEELKMVQKDPSRERYAYGERLRLLAINTISSSQLSRSSHTVLQKLVADIRETCNLGMLDGNEVIYIDRVECEWPLRVQLKPGSHVPIHCTALGKLLLAYHDDESRSRQIRAIELNRYTQYTITDPDLLVAQLEQIAAQKYSINNQEDGIGLIAIAVPVRNAQGEVLAGLSVHAPEARFPIAAAIERLPELHLAAEKIGQSMFGRNQ